MMLMYVLSSFELVIATPAYFMEIEGIVGCQDVEA